MNSQIGVGQTPGQPYLVVGGTVFTDLANLIVLTGFASTVGVFATLRKTFASSGYKIPNGKTYRCVAWRLQINSTGTWTAANGRGSFTLTSTDQGMNSASIGTEVQNRAGSTNGSVGSVDFWMTPTVGTYEDSCFWPIPGNGNNYITAILPGSGAITAGANTLQLFGYEV